MLYKRLRCTIALLALCVTGCGGGGGGGTALPASAAAATVSSSTSGAAAAGTAAVAGAPAAATATTATPSAAGGSLTTTSLSSGCGAVPALTNGVEYVAGWAPYSCVTSPWNQPVSASPRNAAYSNAVIATEFAAGNTQPVRSEEAGTYDYGHPVYYASASDPVVKLHCTAYCNTADNGGFPATAHIPAQARPAGGTDAHMAVIQPDGTEIDMWATSAPGSAWTTGSTVTAQAIADCGNFVTGSGFTPTGPAATAGGACLGAGLLRADELLSGTIDHALFLVAQCAVGSQYPAFTGASTDTCTSGQGPALGARLWYDVPVATTNADPNLQPWERAILNALHTYGGYLEDDVGGGANVSGIGFLAESGEAPLVFGAADPFAALTAQQWSPVSVSGAAGTRYVGADVWNPSGVDFAAHMHWLDPCSAHGAC